jgi:hypothetical protein
VYEIAEMMVAKERENDSANAGFRSVQVIDAAGKA